MSDAELLAPVPANDPPPAEAVAPVEPQAADTVNTDSDEAVDATAIEAPDGKKFVELTALTRARAKNQELKTKVLELEPVLEKATQLEQQLRAAQDQLNAALPEAQAYRAALAAQPRDEPQGPLPEEKAALEEIARDYDFYKGDGTLDLEKAGRHQMRVRREAEAITKQHIAPMQAQTLRGQSEAMLANALVTKAPNGHAPDPDILRELWNRVDASVTATKAGAIQVWNSALGFSVATGKLVAPVAAVKADLPPPLMGEKAGGRETAVATLTDSDRSMAKQLGITEKQYAEDLASMPSGWGKR
jgi:hypothetical protein